MSIFSRFKNLWELSAYQVKIGQTDHDLIPTLRKEIPTIKKKPAIIIPPDTRDIFAPENQEETNDTSNE